MRAVGSLRLGGGVPPRVEVDDDVGAGEVEAGAAGLQRDEENGYGGVGLETIDLGLAGFRGERTIEVTVGDFLGGEFLAHETEQAGKLREDEEAVAVVERLLQQFAEDGELGRVGRGIA